MAEKDVELTPHIKEHYDNERETLKLFLKLEKNFREYYEYYLCEIEKQKGLFDRLWLLSQRYLILFSTGPCCQYPEVYTLSAEETIINEYEEKLEAVRASKALFSNLLKHAVLELNGLCNKFFECYNKLDMQMETPFIMGDKYHKPIKHYKEMVTDIFNYFYATVLKMKMRMHQLDPMNCSAIEEYKPLFQRSEEFEEYLNMDFIYCKCLQPEPVCPIRKRQCPKFNVEFQLNLDENTTELTDPLSQPKC